jgi:hypothetical protein
MTALVAIEGVIAEDNPDGLTGASTIDEGITLFHALARGFHIVLSSLEQDEATVHRWLATQAGIVPRHWARLLRGERLDATNLATRQRHVMLTRSSGYDLRYVVDPDPRVALHCLRAGVTPLCGPHPLYARASFLPDSQEGGASWDAINAALVTTRNVRAQDPRGYFDDDTEDLGLLEEP